MKMQKTEPLVSVIILNWNGEKYIHDCLRSVVEQDYPHIEIVIADNGSTDGSLEKIQSTYPNLKYVINGKNLGYAEGMNTGIRVANGEYVIPLNLDVYLPKNYVATAVKIMEEESDLAVIAGDEYFWVNGELTDELNHRSGAFYLNQWIRVRVRNPKNRQPQYCFSIVGSFPFVRRAALEDVHQVVGYYYDPKFETDWEDTDLWFRMHWRGWKCKYDPRLKAWHVRSASSGEHRRIFHKSYEHQRKVYRNRRYIIEKNLTQSMKHKTAWQRYLLCAILPVIYFFVSWKSLRAWFDGRKGVTEHWDAIQKDHQKVMESAQVSDAYFDDLWV